jgi:hypothetical protein
MNTPLESLKNPRLVYSLIMHFLGRGIFCSKLVHERFKLLLKKRIKDSCNELDSMQFYKEKLNKLNAKKQHNIDEVIVPYTLVANDFQKWTNEPISWPDYLNELSVREVIMNKLREKCSKFDISDSTDFFVDLMANLQLDNYCNKSLRNSRGKRELSYVSERTTYWTFPLKIEIKCEQKKHIPSSRSDSVYRKLKHKYIKLDYNDLEDELDPYVHGGHFRAILGNDVDELDFYFKKHLGRQIISELAFQMFGVEVQKNPAALIYNMMTLDLIDGDKLSQRECFSIKNREFNKEHGLGGVLPCSFEGNTTAARYLNIYYSFIFNHWYSYDINEETEEKIFENVMNPKSDYNERRGYKIRFEEMMQREYDLINKWITFKKERDRKARNLRTIQELWNYVFLRTQQWFEPLKFFLNEPKK